MKLKDLLHSHIYRGGTAHHGGYCGKNARNQLTHEVGVTIARNTEKCYVVCLSSIQKFLGFLDRGQAKNMREYY